MARPSILTRELIAQIESFRAPGRSVPALHVMLVAAGATISSATLRRYLAGAPSAQLPERPPAPAQAERRAVAALEAGDDLDELRASAREIAAARLQWATLLGYDRGAVLAHSRLTERGVELAQAIRALAPPPAPDPSRDPGNVAARTRLLALVDEVLSRDA